MGVNDLYNPQDPWAHYITNALKAKELFIKDVNYIIKNDEAVIVDEFTEGLCLAEDGVMDNIKQSKQKKVSKFNLRPRH